MTSLDAPWAPARATALEQVAPTPAPIDDIAACRELLHQGSLTFFAASLLLPKAVREPASALYAFCRIADDGVDNSRSADQAHAAIALLRTRLHRAYEGRPLPLTADRALAHVVARHQIPQALPEALLEGFAWDADGRRYDTLDQLHAYAARVAGSVGAMMALLMGVRSADGLARACDLGVAMQLSNIARDVGEDARMGRLYLPRAWMRDAGLDPDIWLAQPRFSPALGQVVQRLLDAADDLYERVDAGVALLPLGCRPGINAARFLYAEIGHEVARRGLDSISQRAVVSPSRKALLLGWSVLCLTPPQAAAALPPLPQTRYLVDAAAGTAPLSVTITMPPPWWDLVGRVVWVIDLFERMGQRERAPFGPP
ncbi:MAG: phytoene/squalene synthase family protein [Pseudomonadota bacterium]